MEDVSLSLATSGESLPLFRLLLIGVGVVVRMISLDGTLPLCYFAESGLVLVFRVLSGILLVGVIILAVERVPC